MRPEPQWTAGSPNTAPGGGLHEAFARWARLRPGATALVEGERLTTYAQLDGTSDAWAAQLADAGVGRGDVVPILLPRSTELVTALLAVLKTGAAYSLLPPDWPAQRLRDVLGQLRPPLVIAPADQDPPAASPTPVWSPPAGTTEAPPGFRPIRVDAADPCCVFFTSGTTGRPKGVLTPHRATARLFQPGTFARFTTDTVMPLAAATPWDAFSLELWSVLLNGGTSLIVTDPYLSAAALADAVSRHGADTVWLTSSLFNMIVDEAPDSFRGLRQVAIGGERLSAGHVRRFLRRHPGIALLNGYGPVESTVFATTHCITEPDCDAPGGIPLGRPVPGTQVHVLDGTRPCAVGETGEICLAGDGLALQYLGDPALTAATFDHVRLSGQDVRVYRTGDLGHRDHDGLLRFDGRADRQLKIRGHRVEPAEVERQVEQLLPDVHHCRVLPRGEAADGSLELVAYCVPVRPGDPLDGAQGVLQEALVAYQCPAAVVAVDAFPVTARGKLDERALQALAPTPERGTPDVPPGADATRLHGIQDPVARAVAEAFASVLGREAVALDVPFVHLGGTSLGAGRLCARLAARLSRPVPVSWLYEHPTVAGLAAQLAGQAPPPAAPAETADLADLALTPLQLVHLTRQLLDPQDRTGHCLLTWVIEGDLDLAALEAAVAAVHQRHESLRAEYVLDPRPAVQPADVPAPPLEALTEADSVDEALRAVRTHLAEELYPDLGEVWRTAVVPVRSAGAAEQTAVFGCVVHHVAFDGWSERVLAADLATAYQARLRSFHRWSERVLACDLATSHQPGLGIPAAALGPRPSLAVIHRKRLARQQQTHLENQRALLHEELADVPALRWPAAPTVREQGAPGRIEAEVPAAVLARVDAAASRAGVTRFVVLLQLWAGSLAEVTGQRDFAVGVPVAQRDGAELEHAIGCHITMLCLRMRGAALEEGAAAVADTGRIAARAFAAQDVPYPEVLSLAEPPGDGRPPLYQTLFACQDNAPPLLELPGARATFVRQPYLDLPLELHAELWPVGHGGLHLDVAFRSDAVTESTARDVTKLFMESVHTIAAGAPS
ncbi:amino acid adenylation domain-containing protein [Streptomyces inhibens]|uniref:Amino acid adenylation domain-containing protein n=1 Tax=Streptomyces inhibens TaxID=2293571 RepID=A0A371PPW4_STRIH|nr:non-ribosomal peptide synthetase [Streptomyces inhibens]REK84535.1 amino acid adenylation domain-containing protein [Streptomyces inhibens]